MTHDELMSLRDVTPYYGQREEIQDGKRVIIPVPGKEPGGDWFVADDAAPLVITDSFGVKWRIGVLDGERVRRRSGW